MFLIVIQYLTELFCFFSEEAEGLAKRLKLRFYRASVKEDMNVNEGNFVAIGMDFVLMGFFLVKFSILLVSF